jgi:hypothetical protein
MTGRTLRELVGCWRGQNRRGWADRSKLRDTSPFQAGLSRLAPTIGCALWRNILACHSGRASRGFRPASESRNPVFKAVRAFTPAVDYWVPARASPVEPGSLGRDDNPYAIALPFQGGGMDVRDISPSKRGRQQWGRMSFLRREIRVPPHRPYRSAQRDRSRSGARYDRRRGLPALP